MNLFCNPENDIWGVTNLSDPLVVPDHSLIYSSQPPSRISAKQHRVSTDSGIESLDSSICEHLDDSDDSSTFGEISTSEESEDEGHLFEDHSLLDSLIEWPKNLDNLIASLHARKEEALQKTAQRHRYLQTLVDRWHSKISLKIETHFNREIETATMTVENIRAYIEQCKKSTAIDISVAQDQVQALLNLQQQLSVTVLNFSSSLGYDMLGTFAASCVDSNEVQEKEVQISSKQLGIPQPWISMPIVSMRGQPCLLRSFTTRSTECEGYLATGLASLRNGEVIVSDVGQDSAKIFSSKGRYLRELNLLPYSQPTQSIELPDGRIAVATKSSVKLFTASGEFLKNATKDIHCPQSMCGTTDGNLLITDYTENGMHTITTYLSDLKTPLHFFNERSQRDQVESFGNPWYLATNKNSNIIISDRENHCVKGYTSKGHFLWSVGEQGAGPSQLFHPAGIVVDRFGHVMVADSGNGRVQMFSGGGEWLGMALDGIEVPMDLAIDSHGHLMVLQGNGTVGVYKYMC